MVTCNQSIDIWALVSLGSSTLQRLGLCQKKCRISYPVPQLLSQNLHLKKNPLVIHMCIEFWEVLLCRSYLPCFGKLSSFIFYHLTLSLKLFDSFSFQCRKWSLFGVSSIESFIFLITCFTVMRNCITYGVGEHTLPSGMEMDLCYLHGFYFFSHYKAIELFVNLRSLKNICCIIY